MMTVQQITNKQGQTRWITVLNGVKVGGTFKTEQAAQAMADRENAFAAKRARVSKA